MVHRVNFLRHSFFFLDDHIEHELTNILEDIQNSIVPFRKKTKHLQLYIYFQVKFNLEFLKA